MNHAPKEITVEDLPTYREETRKNWRNKGNASKVGSNRNRSINRNPIMRMTANDGTSFYLSIENVLEKVTIWLTKSKTMDVYYQLSVYIKSADDIRRIAVLIGVKQFADAVSKAGYIIDDDLIESLFENSKAIYFISNDSKRMLSSAFEMNQQKYGPLQSISSIKALKKYGVSALEEAVERGIAAIHG